jgi:5-hydroxyisourate hydrolase
VAGHPRKRMTAAAKSDTMAAVSLSPPAPMGFLTTHVLDTMNGCPAAGMRVALYRIAGDAPQLLRELALDADGRAGGPLLEGEAFQVGRYRLAFEVGAYFRGRGAALPEPEFLDRVPLDFGIADAGSHYHVPLLASPWAYSTYRGS